VAPSVAGCPDSEPPQAAQNPASVSAHNHLLTENLLLGSIASGRPLSSSEKRYRTDKFRPNPDRMLDP
jgi:hypothetical protein